MKTPLKQQLTLLLHKAITEAGYDSSGLKIWPVTNQPGVDYTTNIAILLGKQIGRSPLTIAKEITDRLEVSPK